jgi:hypothetical protein
VFHLSPAFNFTLDAAAAANYRLMLLGIVQVLIIFLKA